MKQNKYLRGNFVRLNRIVGHSWTQKNNVDVEIYLVTIHADDYKELCKISH